LPVRAGDHAPPASQHPKQVPYCHTRASAKPHHVNTALLVRVACSRQSSGSREGLQWSCRWQGRIVHECIGAAGPGCVQDQGLMWLNQLPQTRATQTSALVQAAEQHPRSARGMPFVSGSALCSRAISRKQQPDASSSLKTKIAGPAFRGQHFGVSFLGCRILTTQRSCSSFAMANSCSISPAS